MNRRLKDIHARIQRERLDGLFVSAASNLSYLSGHPSRDSYAVVSPKGNIYLTDSRYFEEIKRTVHDFQIREIDTPLTKTVADCCASLKIKRLGFEADHISFSLYERIKSALPTKCALITTRGLVEGLRQIKSPEEIEKIRQSCRITMKALAFAKRCIEPGMTERAVAGEIERFIRLQGATNAAFDIIVGSGPNGAYPHHITSERTLKANDSVLIDMGVDYQGYKSDLTRVYFLGKINSLQKKVYSIVREAQKWAIELIRPGISMNAIDSAARQYITEQGYGGYFGHSLGHGVGLDVHEAPVVSCRENKPVAAAMIFTIEPGIYLPGKFGVRIEDMVLVTQKGVEVISGSLNK